MPDFAYKASKADGTVVDGVKQAPAKEDIIDMLHSQNLMVIKVEEKVSVNFSKISQFQIGGIPLSEKVLITRQLATMLGAGLSVTQAIEVLIQQQTKYLALKQKLGEVYKDVQGGLPLSYGFSHANILFNEMQINLISAGEKSGNMVEIMNTIADDMKKSSQLQGKIKGAMIYPVIIIVVIVLVVILMMVFMVPSVAKLYKDFGAKDLPWITQVMIDGSNFITNPLGGLLLISLTVAGFISYRAFRKSQRGRMITDELLLKIPVFGDLVMKIEMLRFSRLFGMLLRSGIPIINALNFAAMSLQTYQFQYTLKLAAIEVAKGQPVSLFLAKSKVIPILAVKLIATGEQTGKLDTILKEIESYYEDQVEEITSNLTKLMEPMILLLAGGVTGFLAIAIYLPIYQLVTLVK